MNISNVWLGDFSKLPVELRLLIWDELFSGIKSTPKAQELSSTYRLSIFRTCSYLYEEISWHFYQYVRHAVSLHSTFHKSYYMAVTVSSPRFNFYFTWRLKDSAALRGHLLHFPHTKIKSQTLHIEIRHQEPRISCTMNLWLKVNDLAQILANLECNIKVHVDLLGEWLAEDQPRCANFNCTNFNFRRAKVDHYFYDYDLAILPFSKLPNWSYRLPTTLLDRISEESSNVPHSMLYNMLQLEHDHGKTCFPYLEKETWMVKARYTLDRYLDDLEEISADYNRRDRFIKWFSADGRSAYEEQFLRDLENHYDIILPYDNCSWQILNRYCELISLSGLMRREPFAGVETRFQTWTPEEWLSRFPNGLHPLNRSFTRFLSSLGKTFSSYPSLPNLGQEIDSRMQSPLTKFLEDLYWWTFNSKILFSETDFPCGFFNCSLCLQKKSPCRWCKKYDYLKRCGFCREGVTDETLYLHLRNYWHTKPKLYSSYMLGNDEWFQPHLWWAYCTTEQN